MRLTDVEVIFVGALEKGTVCQQEPLPGSSPLDFCLFPSKKKTETF